MIGVEGYSILEVIYEGAKNRVLKGVDDKTGNTVALKIPAALIPSGTDLAILDKQFDLMSTLDVPGVPKALDRISTGQSMAIAMEHYEFPSLKTTAAKLRLTMPEVVAVFEKLSDILSQLHRNNIIHRDITPANVLYERETGQVVLIDYGSAIDIPLHSPKGVEPEIIEGTLHYMSPEQTGRINRPLDYRSDIYSLGVAFYEMLTGHLPFDSIDFGEIIHSHIAVDPIPPHERSADIPKPLSDIIMKCMAKDAVARYQSARGLHDDLHQCLSNLEKTGEIPLFTIGETDFSGKFIFPERLFGRAEEFQTLHSHYGKMVDGRNAIVMVSGHSGVGKTSLVQELNRNVATDYGYITYGKYDQYSRNTPYSALIQAFSFLIKQILTEDDAKIRKWKESILDAVGTNGSVMTDMIPELQVLTGKLPPVQSLAPADARTRLRTVFSSFIQAFGSREHPLVVFLDDLQWIDSSSLSLIELFGSMKVGSAILFVGAYRSNEVSESHPLTISLGEMKSKGTNIAELALEPLKQVAVKEFMADMLLQDPSNVADLSSLVFKKTEGNPLFFRTFLSALHDSSHINFNHDSNAWEWDIKAISDAPYTDNVVEALRSRIETLPEESMEILKLGACTGSSFALDFLTRLSGLRRKEIAQLLKPAIAQGLVTSSRTYFELYSQEQADKLAFIVYRFAHDRIQQATYALLEEQRRPALHLKAGRMLMNLPEAEWSETHLFDVATHMKEGASLITDAAEQYAVAELVLRAGEKASQSTAFADAAELLDFARSILPDPAWGERYELTCDVHFEYAEALSLSAQYEEAEAMYDIITKNISRDEDVLRLYNIQVKQYHYQARFAEAVDIEFKGLALMGIDIPESDEDLMPFFGGEAGRIAELLEDRNPDELFDAPENTDEMLTRKLELLFDIFADSYLIGRGLLCGVAAAVMARLSMENGNNPMASVSYINYATAVCSIGADYPTGHAFGSVAVRLADKYSVPALQNYTYHLYALSVNHWQNELSTSHEYWAKASKLALASGSPYAGYVFLQLAHVLLASGAEIDTVEQQIGRSRQFLAGAGLDAIITLLNLIVSQPVKHLRGKTFSIETLDDETFSTEKILEEFKELPFFTGSLYYSMLRVACLSGKILPLETLQEWITVIDNTQQGQIILADCHWFYALLLIEGREQANESDKPEYQELIDAEMERMRSWGELCDVNFQHKYALLRAENGRASNSQDDVIDLYDEAILKALDESFIQDAALAAEKAGRFWINRSKPYVAKSYIEQACIYYARWGATCKVDQLREQFREYLTQYGSSDLANSFQETMTMNPFVTGSWSFSEGLDLSSVIKATQAVSKNIVMEELGRDLVSIAIENAGASKGMLLVDSGGGFMISSSMSNVAGIRTPGRAGIPYYDSEELSQAVVNYVIRTGRTVVLDDAPAEEQFAQCEYICSKKPASICCMPIKRQDEVKAVLYLENDITTGVFRQDRLQTLEILAAQATISMENARGYQELSDMNQNLEHIVWMRTKELHDKNDEMNDKNVELERLSTTDQLTGIFNRRRLDEELEREVGLCQRYQKSVAVILFDVDNFKLINDRFGHGVGDNVLIKIASVVTETVRKTDILGRWGGEEFLVIVPEFAQKAEQIAEKIRAALEAVDHPLAETVTVSLGVALYREGDTASTLVTRADDALYQAKENGRNRVEIAE